MGDVDKVKPRQESDSEDETSDPKNYMAAKEVRAKITQGIEGLAAIRSYFTHDVSEEQVGSYIVEGGNVSELVSLLSKVDIEKNISQAMPVFYALHHVIIKIFSDFPDRREGLVNACKGLKKKYLPSLYTVIVSNSPTRFKKTALKLLTAISSVSEPLARDILSILDIPRDVLNSLVEHFGVRSTDNLRVIFINFLLSFIIERPASLISLLLSKKGLLVSIFPGLKHDTSVVVQLVLSSILSHIVQTREITKTQKLHVFNTHTLLHLIELYNWNPNAEVKPNKKSKNQPVVADVDPEEKEMVRGCVHPLLMLLCSSVKYGVVFSDPSYGISTTHHNHLLLTVVQNAGQPWEDPLKEELIVNILSSSPDIIKVALPSFASYTQMESKVLKAIKFFTKVIKNLDLNVERFEDKYCLRLATNLIAHSVLLKALKKDELFLTDDMDDRMVAIKALNIVLDKVIEFNGKVASKKDPSSKYTSGLSKHLCSNLPLPSLLLESFHLWNKENSEKGMCRTIHALLLYNKACPVLLETIRFDKEISKSLDDCANQMVASSDGTALRDVIALKAIQLRQVLDPQDLSKEFGADIGKLSKILIHKSASFELCLEVIKERLIETGFFFLCQYELDLWLYFLKEFPLASDLISSGVAYTTKNMAKLFKYLTEAEEKGSSLVEESCVQLELDDFLNLYGSDSQKKSGTVLNTGLNISPLLPAILKVMKEEKGNSEKEKYIQTVVTHLFHYQVSPSCFIALLKLLHYKPVDGMLQYLQSWNKVPCPLEFLPFVGTVFHEVSQYLLLEDFREEPLEKLDVDDVMNVELCFKQVLFTVCQLSSLERARKLHLKRAISIVNALLPHHKGAHMVLKHPHLLRDFHPIRKSKNSNLTHFVLCIMEGTQVPEDLLAPYSERLVFELKYAMKRKTILKHRNLKIILTMFPFTKEDVMELLKLIISLDLSLLRSEGSLSPWAEVLMHLLQKASDFNIELSSDDLTILLNVLNNLSKENIDIKELCDIVYVYLKKYKDPDFFGSLNVISKDLLYSLCNNSLGWHRELCILLRDIIGHVGNLYSEINIDRAVPLLATSPCKPVNIGSIIDSNTDTIINALISEPSPWLGDLAKLIEPFMGIACCVKISNLVKQNWEEVAISQESLAALQLIFKKASQETELVNILQHCLLRSVNSLNHSQSEQVSAALSQCVESASVNNPVKLTAELIKLLLSNGLKNRIPSHLQVLTQYVIRGEVELTYEMIFDLVTSHSSFLDILLGSHKVKFALLTLITELVEKDKSLLKTLHIPIFLSAYHATLSINDQLILKLLRTYEINGISILDWKPCMWGDPAVDHYSVKEKPVLVEAATSQTLGLLDLSLVDNTVKEFPLTRGLKDEGIVEGREDIYDPAFILPMISQVLAPGSPLAGSRLIAQSGALSLTFASLASSVDEVRLAAYYVLQRQYSSLTATKDNQIWSHLLETFQGGLKNLGEESNARLSSIITTFLARTCLILTDPLHVMYYPLQNFLWAKPHINLNSVPAFLELFNSSEVDHVSHHQWILLVLRDGLREPSDLQLAFHCFVFKLMLDFYSCSLATPQSKAIIEEIVENCIVNVDTKNLLIKEYSALPWLNHFAVPTSVLDKISAKIPLPYNSLFKYIYDKAEAQGNS